MNISKRIFEGFIKLIHYSSTWLTSRNDIKMASICLTKVTIYVGYLRVGFLFLSIRAVFVTSYGKFMVTLVKSIMILILLNAVWLYLAKSGFHLSVESTIKQIYTGVLFIWNIKPLSCLSCLDVISYSAG